MKIKVFEAFAGIGTQRMALNRLGIEHEVVAISEIDKFAIKSYEAIHGDTLNLGDISKINPKDIPDHDLFTYSFPCQDISLAGKQQSLEKGSGTRSSLLWECEKVIKAKRPQYLLMENVKNLVGKKHKEHFEKWLKVLENYGYKNYWEVLNAKDYGIPQNRERVFCVSILHDNQGYEFPKGEELKIRLKDLLEDEVDEKFYLSEEQANKIKLSKFNQEKKRIQEKEYCDTLCARDFKDPKCVRIGGIFDKDSKTHQAGSIWDKGGLSPTLDTMQGGWRQPSVLIGASRGRNPKNHSDRTSGIRTEQRLEINIKGTSNTIPTVQKDNLVVEFEPVRIRKLTPKECWRLMGVFDEDFEKAQKVNSNSQLYKQAGNAIVVDVLEAIFRNLFTD